ncbi:hypothetical protein LZ554_002033 [Drepanopeziza brunnea f. sp. 'monogermtubi']|nr:hypothetical protein LZ554_002033 [Drepanopeziza brunnea f. sp. 'monogermtubi']
MATPSTQASFGQILGTDIATITVGSGTTAKTFKVHTDLICSKVPFFKAMFKGNFKEAATQTATLPEDDPLAFELFLGWLYRETVDEISDATLYLIKLFGFAEKYTVVTLMDNTMDVLVVALKEKNLLFLQFHMEEIYQITHESSKMRVFASRCFAFALMTCQDTGVWSTTTLMSMTSTHRYEIVVDSLTLIPSLTLQGIGLFPDPRLAPLCDYHQHGKDEVCPYTKV